MTRKIKKILHPQEIETFYVLPTLRKYLALAMKEKGMKQKDIAALLMINSSAISQYQSNKRADRVHFDQKVLAEIKKSAALIKDQSAYFRETQRLLQVIRHSGVLCQIHRRLSPMNLSCHPKNTGCDPS